MRKFDYILGLPITTDTVTEEFLEFLNSDDKKILVMTGSFFYNGNDYKNTKVGFDALLDNGFKLYSNNNDMAFIPPNVNKAILYINISLDKVVTNASYVMLDYIQNVLHSLELDENTKVGYVCAGSPKLYDVIAFSIIQNDPGIKIIDTKSSADIIYEELNKDKPLQIVYNDIMNFEENSINILGCLGKSYMQINIQELKEALCYFNTIFEVRLGYAKDKLIRKIHKEQLIFELQNNINFFEQSSLVIYNDDSIEQ